MPLAAENDKRIKFKFCCYCYYSIYLLINNCVKLKFKVILIIILKFTSQPVFEN